jgi:hypothetical protein
MNANDETLVLGTTRLPTAVDPAAIPAGVVLSVDLTRLTSSDIEPRG